MTWFDFSYMAGPPAKDNTSRFDLSWIPGDDWYRASLWIEWRWFGKYHMFTIWMPSL